MGRSITRGANQTNSLARAWAPKFEKEALPSAPQVAFAKKFVRPWKFKFRSPDVPSFIKIIPRMPPSASHLPIADVEVIHSNPSFTKRIRRRCARIPPSCSLVVTQEHLRILHK